MEETILGNRIGGKWQISAAVETLPVINHAVEFFTQTKVVVERWPREWARKF